MPPEKHSDAWLAELIARRRANATSSVKFKPPVMIKQSTSSAESVKSEDGPEETPDTLELDANGEF